MVSCLTPRLACVFAARVALGFGEEVVVVPLAPTPGKLLASTRLLVVRPAAEVATALTNINRLLALVCTKLNSQGNVAHNNVLLCSQR